MHLDFTLVDSVAPAFRLLPNLTGMRVLTLGLPRRHDCSQQGLLMWKLEESKEAIRKSIAAMSALEQVRVVVSSTAVYHDPLVTMEVRSMQGWFETLVVERSGHVFGQGGGPLALINETAAEGDEVSRFNQYAQLTGSFPISTLEWPSPPLVNTPPMNAQAHEERFEPWYPGYVEPHPMAFSLDSRGFTGHRDTASSSPHL